MRIEIQNINEFQELLHSMFNGSIPEITGITIDSRLAKPGDLFLPIKGENVDGHDYIGTALSSGASLVLSENHALQNEFILPVDSIMDTLSYMAKYWRSKFTSPVIAITGSNGKTTTKDLLHHVLSSSMKCDKTIGNYNSTIGLPLSILSFDLNSECYIVEMGTNSPGEITTLCNITQPNYGLITNVYEAHTKNLGSLEKIAIEKSNLYKSLGEKGVAFINSDDKFTSKMKVKSSLIHFGFSENTNYRGKISSISNMELFTINNFPIALQSHNKTFASNALAVYAIADTLNIKADLIAERISGFELPVGRGRILKTNKYTIIDETYNANPESMKQGLKAFESFQTSSRHIAILGDMLELGKDEIQYHQSVGKYINNLTLDTVFTTGVLSEFITKLVTNKKIMINHFNNKEQLIEMLKSYCLPGDCFFIKGSRSMAMETIITKGLK
jgi:UDP-N-acetylmuramoyl-tripeptide--D-alanyl-D-alanine ligase